ncbi:glycosyltransferase [uncultured Ilyobacter sp.]|uniref:glycosyltransferase family 2 protein n=1 Tax=uncultured Ilyobacter sp. TaxID=544433 RepID=UPI0029F59D76|nr:glycosyltransferase [uncultured Ilyobacter sp.]
MKFTIIIPHYNSFEKLGRLLKTIPKSKKIEIIVIDDKSDEENLLKEFKLKYNYVNFFTNTSLNKGAGAARNIGLKRAKGSWIIFADADDYFLEGAFDIFEKNKNSNVDLIYFYTTSRLEKTYEISDRHIVFNKLVDKFLENDEEKELRYRFLPPWGKMIKRSVINENKIFFEEIMYSNDIGFSIKLSHAAKEIKAIKKEVYCITRDNKTLSTNLSEKAFDSRYGAVKRANLFLRDKLLKKYQIWTIGYLVKSYKFGLKKFFSIFWDILIHKQKIFPGSLLKDCKLIYEKSVNFKDKKY